MSIEKMMCLSTGHVAAETARQLDGKVGIRDLICEPGPQEWTDKLIVYPHGEYGWLICIAGDALDHMKDDGFDQALPEELLGVLTYAHRHGCEWVLLDRDAELIDELPDFDW